MAPRKPAAPAPKPTHAPHPAKNLGPHLKRPASGEYMTEHHRGATGKKGGC